MTGELAGVPWALVPRQLCLSRKGLDMVKVRYERLRSQTIITSVGPLVLDEHGHAEVTKEIAGHLCDESKYGGIFTRVDEDESEAEEESVAVAEEEETTEPQILPKKKVRRKKKIIKRVRA